MATKRCTFKEVEGISIDCEIDLPESKTQSMPVVLYYHGGALTGGDLHLYNELIKKKLLDAGYAFVSADYRLAPVTKLPEIMEDVEDAYSWVLGPGAKEFGWDPERVAVMGSSAGGYISLMTGTFSPAPKAIVSFYGYGDILGDWYCKPDPFYCQQPAVSEEEAVKNVGGDFPRTSWDASKFYLRCRQQGTWTALVSGMDPIAQRKDIEKYCPEFRVKAGYPPTFLLHGNQDTDVPYEQSVQMRDALKKEGIDVAFYTEEGGGHGFDYGWEKTPKKMQMVLDFLKNYV